MLYCDDCGSITEKNNGPEDGTVRCPRCAGATEESPATSGLALLDDPSGSDAGDSQSSFGDSDLDLFSNETIAQKKRKPKTPTGETKLRLIDDEEDSFPPVTPPSRVPEPIEEEAQQWSFECLACSGTLSIKAVDVRSKLSCPRCQITMVVEADGQVSLPDTAASASYSAGQEDSGQHIDFSNDAETLDHFFAGEELSTEESADPVETQTGSPSAPVTTPSTAALRAAENKCSSDGDTITMAPSPSDEVSDTSTRLQEPALETSLEDALGFLDEEVIDSDDACELLGDPLPHASEEPENSVTQEGHAAPLETATVMLWSGLFALPSLAALLVNRLPLGSGVTQTLSRVGSNVQARCGDFLDQFLPWIGSF